MHLGALVLKLNYTPNEQGLRHLSYEKDNIQLKQMER